MASPLEHFGAFELPICSRERIIDEPCPRLEDLRPTDELVDRGEWIGRGLDLGRIALGRCEQADVSIGKGLVTL